MAPIFLGIVSPELSKRRGTGINISPSDSQKKFLIASHLGSHSIQLQSGGFVINIDLPGEEEEVNFTLQNTIINLT